jgi:hypothetical protein
LSITVFSGIEPRTMRRIHENRHRSTSVFRIKV